MTVNPLGAVSIDDFGAPRIITAIANEVISGGQFVAFSGAGTVTSGAASFVSTDIVCYASASGAAFGGICLQDTTSGNECPVARDGVFIVTAAGTVVASQQVVTVGADAVAPLAGSPSVINNVNHVIGRAIIGGTSGAYCMVDFRG